LQDKFPRKRIPISQRAGVFIKVNEDFPKIAKCGGPGFRVPHKKRAGHYNPAPELILS
jgi:hypothetical protein